MKQKRNYTGNVVLLLHGALYTVLWAAAMYYSLLSSPRLQQPVILFDSRPEQYIVLALLWLPILIAHVAIYFRAHGSSTNTEPDQQAYRDGYRAGYREGHRDGIENRRFASDDDDTRHLALGEDGELVEWEQKQKRGER